MDLLKTAIDMYIKKQAGLATTIAIAAVVISFGLGLYFQHFTKHVDHPVEQAAEKVLDSHGVEVDFSKDKKQREKEEIIEEVLNEIET